MRAFILIPQGLTSAGDFKLSKLEHRVAASRWGRSEHECRSTFSSRKTIRHRPLYTHTYASRRNARTSSIYKWTIRVWVRRLARMQNQHTSFERTHSIVLVYSIYNTLYAALGVWVSLYAVPSPRAVLYIVLTRIYLFGYGSCYVSVSTMLGAHLMKNAPGARPTPTISFSTRFFASAGL